MTESNPVGRPLKFKSLEELQEKIDAYFASTGRQVDKDGKEYFEPVTITGLALALGTSRKVLMEYENKDEYSNTIKEAKLRCENFAERMLYLGKSPTGPIFALKNFSWTDKTETDITSKGEKLGWSDYQQSLLDEYVNKQKES